jgi:hypothetical protein
VVFSVRILLLVFENYMKSYENGVKSRFSIVRKRKKTVETVNVEIYGFTIITVQYGTVKPCRTVYGYGILRFS